MDEMHTAQSDLALSELLDRALNKGVFVYGELTISLADVELVYVGVKALLASTETARQLRENARLER